MITKETINDKIDELYNAQYHALANSGQNVTTFLNTPEQRAVTRVINELLELHDALTILEEHQK